MILPILVLLSSLQISPPPQPADTAPDTLHILVDSTVLNELDRIADTATVEHLRCLLGGYLPPDTVVVTRLFAPKERRVSRFRVSVDSCPEHTVGTWHIHLPIGLRRVTDTTLETVPIPAAAACYFSSGDVREAAHHPELAFYMVHIQRGIYGWWTAKQVYLLSHGWQPIGIPCLAEQRKGL